MRREALRAVDIGLEPEDVGEFKHQRMEGLRVTARPRVVLDADYLRPDIGSERGLRPARALQRTIGTETGCGQKQEQGG